MKRAYRARGPINNVDAISLTHESLDAAQAFVVAAGAAAGEALGVGTSFALSPELLLSPDPEALDPASAEPESEEAAAAEESPLPPAAGLADA